MKLKSLSLFLFILFLTKVNAQSAQDDVLFSVGEDAVYASEFIRVYNKNLDLVQDESQKDVDEYLKLFTNYKLKLKEARALGFDEKPSYIRELSNYRKQLAKSFVTDTKVTEALIEEAYQRISYDIKANHILIKIDENASPADTLLAYNNILKLRNRALNEGFDVVRKEVHNGQTIFGEELGYFSGFKMVYKFESAAFNTPVGEISQPFRTRFGYHIVNVQDKRESRGERTVAHIMVVKNEADSLAEKPENRIQDIYKKIQQGEDFEALAKQFSDDKATAPKGGMLAPFSSGQISVQKFEDVAFGLKSVGDVSEPFQTQYGWHIVKLYNKKPIPAFEVMKPELEQKVKRDSRSKLIDEALYNSLKEKYNITTKQPALKYFEAILNDDYLKGTWKLPNNFEADKPLIKIGDKQFYFKDFGAYLLGKQRGVDAKSTYDAIVLKQYDAFLNESLVTYQEDNLENENEEFAYIVEEYRDGLLLFDLMENTIWNTAKKDSVEIHEYYNAHKSNYTLPKQVDAVVASSTKQKTLKKVAKLLEQGMALEQIKSLVNSNDKVEVIFTTGIMDSTHQALPKGVSFKKGLSKIYNHNNAFVVVEVKEILPETQKTFDEAKGAVISDYQTNKEEKWIKGLEEKYQVNINQQTLSKVKSQIKNQ
ncbi:peptidylprolyl isomerase [Thalassobellus suaedae]|uniref:Peptidylprolyl isomerase n=1 Tax=Thalassobellus suaedae TaxID=3074124 RepID=A0ABY9Y0V0_9FLAO|nr:peptidylprolyl isomerase [Flavobacteriaceae bacterium HL-DH10]